MNNSWGGGTFTRERGGRSSVRRWLAMMCVISVQDGMPFILQLTRDYVSDTDACGNVISMERSVVVLCGNRGKRVKGAEA
jgi:hypothetical protein